MSCATLDQVKLCRACQYQGNRGHGSFCRKSPHMTMTAARRWCSGSFWEERSIEPPNPSPQWPGRLDGTTPRLQSRIAELENCLLVTVEAHDRRVAELLAANGREVELRRRANRERDMAQTMLRAIAGALIKAETERDNANVIMREVVAELAQLRADETMTIEDGSE